LEDGNATEYACNYEAYHAQKIAAKEAVKMAQKAVQSIPAPSSSANSDKKEGYYRTKEERAADARRKTRIKKIEEEIAALETEDADLNAALSDPAVTANFALLTEKCNRLEEIKNLLDALYAEYETLI
jgi:ATP-binding cassette subfamily F protein 3